MIDSEEEYQRCEASYYKTRANIDCLRNMLYARNVSDEYLTNVLSRFEEDIGEMLDQMYRYNIRRRI